MPQELHELIEISRAVGADPDLAQGGGGNTSVKSRSGDGMYIKASGAALADVSDQRGWARLDLRRTRSLLAEGLEQLPVPEREARILQWLQLCVLQPLGARPSVESNLHAVLGRVVIHSHPVGLNALLSTRNARKEALELLGSKYGEPLYLSYIDPGYTLAARVAREIASYTARKGRGPTLLLLENHGLFVSAETVEECLAIHRDVTDLGARWSGGARVNPTEFPVVVSPSEVKPDSAARVAEVRGALLSAGCESLLVREDVSPVARELLSTPAALASAGKGMFTPDQIVYCRGEALVLQGAKDGWADQVKAYRKRLGLDPRVIIVRPDARSCPAGLVAHAAPDLAQLRVVAEVHRSALLTLLRAGAAGGPRFLQGEERAFIEGWEVEKFRAALLAGGARRLKGKIAAVTGAASGLGKGISRGLAGAGATVLGLDLNRDALEATRAEFPAGSFLPCQADVTDEASIAAAFRALEASVGGLDILVNAAGIAPSFPIADFPLGAWRKTLEINLTGYFLCGREAVRVFQRQGSGGAIINLTSKSGLDASKENSAYNATKAGEIHLMRGWALELGKAGVRVNCVAPGNVFKGSQIWNEEYIKACARKKGIKPEEVIPYYTSLAPLGKEIEPEDIANAVVFLVSDEARNITGQVLVVDGGQVMVR